MYGLGVAEATRGNSPLEGLASPSTSLNPLPPAISGSKYKLGSLAEAKTEEQGRGERHVALGRVLETQRPFIRRSERSVMLADGRGLIVEIPIFGDRGSAAFAVGWRIVRTARASAKAAAIAESSGDRESAHLTIVPRVDKDLVTKDRPTRAIRRSGTAMCGECACSSSSGTIPVPTAIGANAVGLGGEHVVGMIADQRDGAVAADPSLRRARRIAIRTSPARSRAISAKAPKRK